MLGEFARGALTRKPYRVGVTLAFQCLPASTDHVADFLRVTELLGSKTKDHVGLSLLEATITYMNRMSGRRRSRHRTVSRTVSCCGFPTRRTCR
jgi:hypothetical protein